MLLTSVAEWLCILARQDVARSKPICCYIQDSALCKHGSRIDVILTGSPLCALFRLPEHTAPAGLSSTFGVHSPQHFALHSLLMANPLGYGSACALSYTQLIHHKQCGVKPFTLITPMTPAACMHLALPRATWRVRIK